MKQESIKQATNIIIDAISDSDIEPLDKMELLMNINHFLMNYEEKTKCPVEPKKKVLENDRI